MNLMDSAKEKIYPGAKVTVLESVTELLSIKADTNMSQHTYDHIISWGQRMLPEENNMVHNFYETKKLVGLLEPSGKVLLDANIDAEGKWEISISRSGQFVHGACRDPARWFGEIFNCYTFEEFYPTPKTISKDVYGIWYSQFRHKYSCPGFSEIQIEKAFKKLVAKQYSGKVWDMKQKWLKDGLPSANCTASVWEQWKAYWTSEKFQRNSEIAKTNKNSKEGQRSVQKEVQRQVEQEREDSYRQLESKFEERLREDREFAQRLIQEDREVAQRQFEERMQQVLTTINLQQQQPTSGNASASSVGQYLDSDGGRGTSRRSGGRGRGRH